MRDGMGRIQVNRTNSCAGEYRTSGETFEEPVHEEYSEMNDAIIHLGHAQEVRSNVRLPITEGSFRNSSGSMTFYLN